MIKIKKFIISTIVLLIAIIGISTISNAYYVGQILTITDDQYLTSSNIFCMEHGQDISDQMQYKIISQVRIEGTKSTDQTGKTIDHIDNARLAYILSQDNGSVKWTGPVANAIIKIENVNYITDANGLVAIFLEAKAYQNIEVSKTGYTTQSNVSVTVTNKAELKEIELVEA